MKRALCILLASILAVNIFVLPALAEEAGTGEAPEISAPCAVLADIDGNILWEKNGYESRPPASVTKIMTLLLIMEALEQGKVTLEETVTASKRASQMGGTQIYLAQNEQMKVYDLLKAIAVSSANDACVAMAERISGSVENFVAQMNARADELGMDNTNFENCNGLSSPQHVTCAADIAVMSAALMRYDLIREFAAIWTDTIRDGAFTLTNTNKMIRYYEGATGLKTGFTSEAMYCISATAKKHDLELIAVVMGAPTIENRTRDASAMLDYGFATYESYDLLEEVSFADLPVQLGEKSTVPLRIEKNPKILLQKGQKELVRTEVDVVKQMKAPVDSNVRVGTVSVIFNGSTLREFPVVTAQEVKRKSYFAILKELFQSLMIREA